MSYLSNYDFDNFGDDFEYNIDHEPNSDYEQDQDQDQDAPIRENKNDNNNEEEDLSQSHHVSPI